METRSSWTAQGTTSNLQRETIIEETIRKKNEDVLGGLASYVATDNSG